MEKVTGVVERITYQNPEGGYAVLKVRPTEEKRNLFDKEVDRHQRITVTGSLQALKVGVTAEFFGSWEDHSKYGVYLDVQRYRAHTPTTKEGLKKFLASDHFKGIGPSYARRLVKRFGKKLPEIIEKSPKKLTKVKGITRDLAEKTHKAWQKAEKWREDIIRLQGLGLSPNLAQKILDQYSESAVQKVREKPYQLAEEVWGIGFNRADKIAVDLGFKNTTPQRVQAGIQYALKSAGEDGHVFLPRSELIEKAQKLLGVDRETIQKQLDFLLSEEKLILDKSIASSKEALYLRSAYEYEEGLAQRLKTLWSRGKENSTLRDFSSSLSKKQLAKLIRDSITGEFDLAKEQTEAIKKTLRQPVVILTGGPGTGKSTTIDTLVKVLQTARTEFVLSAPTGRAAKRLTEITGQDALTLHRLLGLRPGELPQYHEDNPLPYQVVIVDEASMLDMYLAYNLLNALEPGAHLLLVGDAEQLPSVQAGNVLRDLIESNQFPVVTLQTIFRQADQSAIVRNAHRIKNGQFPETPPHPTDFYFFTAEELGDVKREIVSLVSERIPGEFGFDTRHDLQVLAPLYKTKAGVNELNKSLQETVNPRRSSVRECKVGYQLLREGDRVMQLKNNYDKEVYNGEVGQIRGIRGKRGEPKVVVRFTGGGSGSEVTYEAEELDQISLAYAISVHKSQGSEYPVVVMPVHTSHYIMLQRNLLYTAVTRAKELVVLVGNKKAVYIALNNDKPQLRHTGLDARLKAGL